MSDNKAAGYAQASGVDAEKVSVEFFESYESGIAGPRKDSSTSPSDRGLLPVFPRETARSQRSLPLGTLGQKGTIRQTQGPLLVRASNEGEESTSDTGQPGFNSPPSNNPSQPGFNSPPTNNPSQPGFNSPPTNNPSQPGFNPPPTSPSTGASPPHQPWQPNQQPSNPGAGLQQPNQQKPRSSGGILLVVAGVFAALLLLGGAIVALTRNGDSSATDTTTAPSPSTTPASPTATQPAEPTKPSQAVPDGEFALSLEDTDLPPNAFSQDEELAGPTSGNCFEVPTSSIGLVKGKSRTFSAPDSDVANPWGVIQQVFEFDTPQNAQAYFDSVAGDNLCSTSIFEEPEDTFDVTVELLSPRVYGDDTVEVKVDGVGTQTDTEFHHRQFVLHDGKHVYYTGVLGNEEFPRNELTAVLNATARNLGLA